MQSAWTDRDAEAAIARYEKLGRDVGLRVYTTRLLGKDPRLVLHGGGNTSVKLRMRDLCVRIGVPTPEVYATVRYQAVLRDLPKLLGGRDDFVIKPNRGSAGRGVLVVIEAEHLCMSMRGVRKPGAKTVTSAVRGIIRESQSTRMEAMSLLFGRRATG